MFGKNVLLHAIKKETGKYERKQADRKAGRQAGKLISIFAFKCLPFVKYSPFLQTQRKETGRSALCWNSSPKTCESAPLYLQLLKPCASLGEHRHWGTNQDTAALQPEVMKKSLSRI